MKLIVSTLIALTALSAPAFAGILDGKPADPEKRARPGGYYSQVANLKSLASSDCTRFAVRDENNNFVKWGCV